jgi:hypothetical protein
MFELSLQNTESQLMRLDSLVTGDAKPGFGMGGVDQSGFFGLRCFTGENAMKIDDGIPGILPGIRLSWRGIRSPPEVQGHEKQR